MTRCLLTTFCLLLFLSPVHAQDRRRAFRALAAAGYAANAATFDGSAYLRQTDGIGSSAGKFVLFSAWLNLAADGGTYRVVYGRNGGSGPTFNIWVNATGNLGFRALDSGSSDVIYFETDNAPLQDADGFVHVMFSCDSADSGKRHVYINGSAGSIAWASYANANMVWDRTDWTIGAEDDNSNKFNGCISQLYLTDEYLDLSIAGNRLKFYNGGAEVDPGATGTNPTGTQPRILLDNPFGTFEVNKGSGGNFTVTGALTTCTAP